MKTYIKKLIKGERGKVMIIALILLVVGGLILTPLLGLMSTGLAAGQTYERKTEGLYAADAGVEAAIWHLQSGGSVTQILQVTSNDMAVSVTMTRLNPGQCREPALYEILSRATAADGSSTTVLAQVTNIYIYVESGFLEEGYTIEGNVFAPGDLYLSRNATIQGDTIVLGDLTLNACSLVGGVVCVDGHLTLNEEAKIQSDVYVRKSLLMMGGKLGSWVDGYVYVRGEEMRVDPEDGPFVVKMSGKAEIRKDLWAGGGTELTVQVDNNAKVTGVAHVTADLVLAISGYVGGRSYDYYDHNCPLGRLEPEIKLWLIVG